MSLCSMGEVSAYKSASWDIPLNQNFEKHNPEETQMRRLKMASLEWCCVLSVTSALALYKIERQPQSTSFTSFPATKKIQWSKPVTLGLGWRRVFSWKIYCLVRRSQSLRRGGCGERNWRLSGNKPQLPVPLTTTGKTAACMEWFVLEYIQAQAAQVATTVLLGPQIFKKEYQKVVASI